MQTLAHNLYSQAQHSEGFMVLNVIKMALSVPYSNVVLVRFI